MRSCHKPAGLDWEAAPPAPSPRLLFLTGAALLGSIAALCALAIGYAS